MPSALESLREELFARYPVVIDLPVQWGEMDSYGHVNNTAFFRYFESARIVYLERCGFVEAREREGVGAILHSTSCRFRRPLFYPDTVLVAAGARELEHDRFTMGYELISVKESALAADGVGVVVSYDYHAGRKVVLPERVREGIAALEEGRDR